MRPAYREGLPLVPAYMQHLPVDPRGFPIPWFTPIEDGVPNFQGIYRERVAEAYRKRICWICGGKLHKNLAMVIGPMCAINRTTSEPASHVECATFSCKACPFLTRPRMRRVPAPDGEPRKAPGILLERNPGVCLLWVCRDYHPLRVPNGVLFRLGDPIRIEAFAEGRPATPQEVETSIRGGLPALREIAELEAAAGDAGALPALERQIAEGRRVLGLPTGRSDATDSDRGP